MKNILTDIFGRQVPQQVARQNAIRNELYRTRREIETKMAIPVASTGTPISELNGMARTLAIMANMGDGSIASGGRGVRGGEELMAHYNQLIGMATEAFANCPKQKNFPR